MDILDGLNPAQSEAVQIPEGPMLILAGPGSGKTKVITHRIACLVRTLMVNPHRIMAVTFTNKAANEMKARLFQLLGQRASALTLGTFHATCALILRRDGGEIGIDRNFVIYDDDDQINLLKHTAEDLAIDTKRYNLRFIQNGIESAKSRLILPEDFPRNSYIDEVVARMYQRYQEKLFQCRALDFDDLIMQAVRLFKAKADVLTKYQLRYLHVLIDEFQDTNYAQYIFSRLISGKYRNLCVVGDPDQSIYSWRNADLRNILNFEKDFPDARVIFLEQNYRSTKTILSAAESVIARNKNRKPKRLWTENDGGLPVTIAVTSDEQDEALFVVREIERLANRNIAHPGDCAVMYRTNAQSRALEEVFMRYGHPYRLIGALRFYQRREVKDVIAYLKVIQNPYDNISLLRIINTPARGIGQRSLDELNRFARQKNIPIYTALQVITQEESSKKPEDGGDIFSARTVKVLSGFLSLINGLIAKSKEMELLEFFDLLLKKTGYSGYIEEMEEGKERWENIMEFRTVAADFSDLSPGEGLPVQGTQTGLTAFLERVSLVSDTDNMAGKNEVVVFITLHQAKGLEFPVVFIAGAEEGLLPHSRSMDNPLELEEERRLFFVGMTRAKKLLYILRAYRRSFMGQSGENEPSRFLQDIPQHLCVSSEPYTTQSVLISNLSACTAQADNTPVENLKESYNFRTGDRVRHKMFGEGIVVNARGEGQDREVTIAFKGEAGIKKLLASMAPLEPC